MPIEWGPHYIVPSEVLKIYSGRVMLRETFDEELLKKELEALGIPGYPIKVSNPWYYRRKGNETWVKIGESSDKQQNFPVSWDTTKLENGEYQVFGLMHVWIKVDSQEVVVCRQNVVDVKVRN